MVTQLGNGLDEVLKIITKFPKFPVLLIEIIPQNYFVVRRMFCQMETQTPIWSLPFINQQTVSQKFWLPEETFPF